MALPEHIVSKIMLYVIHPIAYMYREYDDEWDHIINYHCDEYLGQDYVKCVCGNDDFPSTNKVVRLYICTNLWSQPNHKLEKMLELKVVMNQLESQMGIYSEAKLLRGQQQRLEYVTGKFRELQQYHPMFYHCNKDLIMNCLVALIRNIKLELWNYDDLYDQFY